MIVNGISGSLGDLLYTAKQPKYVFNAYKYALGTQQIMHTDYKDNMHVSIIKNSIADEIAGYVSSITTNYGTIQDASDNNMINTEMCLFNGKLGSNNINTSLSATVSYENMFNIPCSAILAKPIENKEKIKNSILNGDDEYDIWVKDKTDKIAEKHMKYTYDFETRYNENEYEALNVDETYITEDSSFIAADNYEYSITLKNPINADDLETQGLDTNGIMSCGCKGILLSYCDSKHYDRNMIPMMYYEFEKPIYSNNNTLNIEWNTNGILRVE